MNESISTTVQTVKTQRSNPSFLGLDFWELGVLGLSIVLLAGVALPNYFKALEELRGKDCTKNLTLLANCLQYLADKNGTKPGEKICEIFDLNEALEKVQIGWETTLNYHVNTTFYKIGSEPDCADVGDHSYSLLLGEDGKVVPPTCSLASGKKREWYKKNMLHVCDTTKVNGKIRPK